MFNKWIFPDSWQIITIAICSVLHQRSAWRLNIITTGIILAKGRKTVTSWFRAAGITKRYKAFYYFVGSIGQKTEIIATVLLEFMIKLVYKNQNRVLMAIDDSPTKRYGPEVAGAGLHRNPTVGPDGAKFLYGHIWVTMSALVRHKLWGTIGLPLLAKMYIRVNDIESVSKDYKIRFQNKLSQAAQLVKWAKTCCRRLGKELWIVTDGGFTRAGFLKPAIASGATIITRLRKDAALHALPKKLNKRKRGRPRKYGKRIYLQNEMTKKKGWFSINVTLYGQQQTKQVKMFKATYRPVGGEVLVLIVREDKNSWRAFMCTNISTTGQEVLEAVTDRSAIEQNFHDLKEIEGAGQQQVRNYWANVGAFHLNMWVHTMVELWSWQKRASVICDRSDSPWDNIERRPSHADRCQALRREVLNKTFFEISGHSRKNRKIVRQFYKLIKLAA